jgi:hypothetical protein
MNDVPQRFPIAVGIRDSRRRDECDRRQRDDPGQREGWYRRAVLSSM